MNLCKIKRLFISSLMCLSFLGTLQAQIWSWAKSVVSTSTNESTAICQDQSLNNYVCGNFSGTATFGSTSLTSSGSVDSYLSKMDMNGNFVWSVKIAGGAGNDYVTSVASNTNGSEIYVTGSFSGTTTFGGSTNLTSLGGNDGYIAKYNSTGGLVWVIQISGTLNQEPKDIAWSKCIGLCTGSFTYVTGKFSGSANFGGTTLTSVGTENIFTACYNNSTGLLVWVKQASSSQSGTGSMKANGIAVNSTDNSVYITGGFRGTATFGNLTLNNSYTSSYDQYLLKYNSSGLEQWVKKSNGIYDEEGKDVCVDKSNNIIVAGTYAGNNSSFGAFTLIGALGGQDLSVVKYNASGVEQWAKEAGGSGTTDNITGISTDSYGNVYIAGDFNSQQINFGSLSLTSDANADSYLARLSPSGIFNKVTSSNGSPNYATIYPTGLTVTDLGTVTYCGKFNYSFIFGATTLSTSGTQNSYVAKVNKFDGSWPVITDGGVANLNGIGDEMKNTETDAQGNTYITGFYSGAPMVLNNGVTLPTPIPNGGFTYGENAYLIKYNNTGKAEWGVYGYSTASFLCGNAVTADASGNVYFAGGYRNSMVLSQSSLSGAPGSSIFLSKYNATGSQQWAFEAARASTSGSVRVEDMTTDVSGNIFLTGSYNNTAFGSGAAGVTLTNSGVYIAKYNNSGVLQWVVNAASAGTGYGIALNGSDIFLVGSYNGTATFGSPSLISTSAGSNDLFVAKYNSAGVGQSVITAGSVASERMSQIASYNGKLYVTGAYQNTINFGGNVLNSGGGVDGLLARIDANTMVVDWIREVKGTGSAGCTGIAVNNNGIYLSGEFLNNAIFGDGTTSVTSTSVGSDDAFLERFDLSGNYMWLDVIGSATTERAIGAGTDAFGNAYITGNFTNTTTINGVNYSAGAGSSFIEKLESFTGTYAKYAGVSDADMEDKKVSNGFNIYPNPSKGICTVDLDEVESDAKIEIYNTMGQRIKAMDVFSEKTILNLSDLPAGIYLISVIRNGKIVSKKIILE